MPNGKWGHLRCLNALLGTKYWPGLEGSVLFVEEDSEIKPQHFDRELQSLIHQPDFAGVQALLIGRFQEHSGLTREVLTRLLKRKVELSLIPIIANVDFGHTTPLATLPVGGRACIKAFENNVSVVIEDH